MRAFEMLINHFLKFTRSGHSTVQRTSGTSMAFGSVL